MIRKKTTTAIAVSAFTLLAAQATAASPASEEAMTAQVRACIDAISARANVREVTRVRHVVTDFDYAPIGYALRIRSEYFNESGEADFRSRCVVSGNSEPLQLRVNRIDD